MTDFPGFSTKDDLLGQITDCIEVHDFEGAFPFIKRLVSFYSDDEMAWEFWVMVHVRLARYQQAIEIAGQAIDRGIAPAVPLMWSASAHRALHDTAAAERDAQRAIAEDPESVSLAWDVLASLRRDAGELDEALAIYWKGYVATRAEMLWILRLELAYENKRLDLVIEESRAFIRQCGKDARILHLLGQAYSDRGDHRRAERAFRDAVELEPENPDYHFNVVMNLIMRGEMDAADAYLDRLDEDDPELAEKVDAAVGFATQTEEEES